MDKQVFIHPRKAGLHHTCWWLGKANIITANVPPSSFSQLLLLSTVPYDLNIPMVTWSLGVSCPQCLLPTSCAPSASLSWETVLHKHWSEWLKHPCVLNTVFITNPNHSTAMNKINSILPKINPKSVYSPYTALGIDWFACPHLAVLELTGRSVYPKH